MRYKNGPKREYPPEQLAIYAQYKDQRALVRPLACRGGDGCWVELGPPALATRAYVKVQQGGCTKCGGMPRTLPIAQNRPYR